MMLTHTNGDKMCVCVGGCGWVCVRPCVRVRDFPLLLPPFCWILLLLLLLLLFLFLLLFLSLF